MSRLLWIWPLLATVILMTCAVLGLTIMVSRPGAGTAAPEGVETINLGDGCTITVDGDDHVTIRGEGESWFGFNGYSYRKSVEFMTEFQRVVRARNREATIKAIAFPLRVNSETPLIVEERNTLLRQFDRIFTPEVVKAILAADPRKVFCNCQGIMLGHGIIWAVRDDDGRYGVRTINLPCATRR